MSHDDKMYKELVIAIIEKIPHNPIPNYIKPVMDIQKTVPDTNWYSSMKDSHTL